MVGDFNAHYDVNNSLVSRGIGFRLNSFLEGNNLSQLISEPTRITQTNASILDPVVANCPNLFIKLKYLARQQIVIIALFQLY